MKANSGRLALTRRLIVIWVLLVVCQQISAQSNSAVTAQGTAAPARQENNSILEFERELREEAKEHREYLKDSLDQLKWAVGAIVVLGGAVFGWLNYKSRKEIRAEVNTRFKTTVETMFDERMGQFDRFLNSNTTKIDETIKKTDQLLGRTADFVSVFTYGFALLERPSKDDRLELARRLRDPKARS
jgi:DNA anti-recombination protein RmuC